MIDRERLLTTIQGLPTFPNAAAELFEVTADPKASSGEVAEIVERDPALTTAVLRVANSARFGLSRRVTGVRHAVTLLGRTHVRNLAVAAATTTVLPRRLPGYDLTATEFFRHSVATAVLATEVAKAADIDAHELTFLGGLLHDIGKLAVTAYLKQETTIEIAPGSLATLAGERAVLGLAHTEVAAMLARHWQLPEIVALVAEQHHDPNAVDHPALSVLISLVHVGDVLAYSIDPPRGSTSAPELQLDPQVKERLELEDDRLAAIVEASRDRIEAMVELVTG